MKKLIMTFLILSSLSFAAESKGKVEQAKKPAQKISLSKSFVNSMMPQKLPAKTTIAVVPNNVSVATVTAAYGAN